MCLFKSLDMSKVARHLTHLCDLCPWRPTFLCLDSPPRDVKRLSHSSHMYWEIETPLAPDPPLSTVSFSEKAERASASVFVVIQLLGSVLMDSDSEAALLAPDLPWKCLW